MMNFGDTFFVDESEFVHLLLDVEIRLAAKIVSVEDTKRIKTLRASADKRGVSQNQPALCYVELSTKEYIDCSANMVSAASGGTIGDHKLIRPTGKKLDNVDLKKIKDEILENSDLFRPSLVEFMKSISI